MPTRYEIEDACLLFGVDFERSALGRPPAAARYPHGLGYSAAAAQQFSA